MPSACACKILIAPALPYSLPCSAADVLGLGSYTQQELFAIYVEFTLLCYTDPGCVLRLLCLPCLLCLHACRACCTCTVAPRAPGMPAANSAQKRGTGSVADRPASLPRYPQVCGDSAAQPTP
jgi:hypothetical protein